MVNLFIDNLKAACNDENKEFIIECIPKIKLFIKGHQFQMLLLNGGLADDEVGKILKFLSEN